MNAHARVLMISVIVFSAASALSVYAQSCPHRGQLDDLYCDANKDMVADVPTDKSMWKNPSTLIFTYAPVEDPAVQRSTGSQRSTCAKHRVTKHSTKHRVTSFVLHFSSARKSKDVTPALGA